MANAITRTIERDTVNQAESIKPGEWRIFRHYRSDTIAAGRGANTTTAHYGRMEDWTASTRILTRFVAACGRTFGRDHGNGQSMTFTPDRTCKQCTRKTEAR